MNTVLNRVPKKTARTVTILATCAMLLTAGAITPGCSVYMEATQPTPVDLAQFQPGETRDTVLEHLGAPTGASNETDGTSCDFYQLYTHGYGAAGKVPIALLEGAADVFTLGMAEAVTTPVEGVTQNQRHPVSFCYQDGKLAKVSENGRQVIAAGSTGYPDSVNATAKDPAATNSAAAASPLRPDTDTGGGRPAVASTSTKSN